MNRINGLGQISQPQSIIVPASVGVVGLGLLTGGLVIKKTPGTIMAVAGGATTLVSLILLISSVGGGAGAPVRPPAPPAAPPPPPAPAKPTSAQMAMQYGQAALPVIQQLFKTLAGRQPAMLVVR